MFKVTPQTTIGELLEFNPGIADILSNIGMHCVGCPSSRNETLEQAAQVHGLDPDDLTEDIIGFLEAGI